MTKKKLARAAWRTAAVAPLLVCAAACLAQPPPAVPETELNLATGPFPSLRGAHLGRATTFENDIDSNECYGVEISGKTIGYLHRAHRTGGRLFVEPCERIATTMPMPPETIYGMVSAVWSEASISGGSEPALTLRPIALPGWSMFSNPAVCGDRIAYWAFDRGQERSLIARISSLSTEAPVASQSLGAVRMETDNRHCIERPSWNTTCTTASFNALSQGKQPVTLRADR